MQELFALTVTSEGAVIVGFSVSSTVTVKLAVATFPAASVAVYVTVVVPNPNTSPELCVLVKVTAVQLSLAAGAVQVTAASHVPASLPTVMLEGIAAITGSVLSTTVIVCVAVAVFPAASVAVHVTTVAPNGKAESPSFVTVTVVQLSLAIGFPRFEITASQLLSAFTVISAGATIVGFVLSSTVTFCVALAVLPALSVTVHVTTVVPNG